MRKKSTINKWDQITMKLCKSKLCSSFQQLARKCWSSFCFKTTLLLPSGHIHRILIWWVMCINVTSVASQMRKCWPRMSTQDHSVPKLSRPPATHRQSCRNKLQKNWRKSYNSHFTGRTPIGCSARRCVQAWNWPTQVLTWLSLEDCLVEK